MNFKINISTTQYVLFLPDIFVEMISFLPPSENISDLIPKTKNNQNLTQDLDIKSNLGSESDLESNYHLTQDRDQDCESDDDYESDLDHESNYHLTQDQTQNDIGEIKQKSLNDDDSSDDESYNFDMKTLKDIGVISMPRIMSKNYKPLPKFYYNLESWPTETTLLCKTCGSNINGRPWFIPLSCTKQSHSNDLPSEIDDTSILLSRTPVKQVIAREVLSAFCHVWCIGRYFTYKNPAISNIWQSKILVKELFKEWMNKELLDIPISIDPSIMEKFCGDGYTEEEYYQLNLKNLSKYVK